MEETFSNQNQPKSKEPSKPFGAKIAQVSSDVFSPLLIPTYAMIFVMWLTPLLILPFGTKAWAAGGVFVITCVIPLLIIFCLIKLGKVSDTAISNRSERTLPFAASVACYVGAAWFMSSLNAPRWLTVFFLGAALVSLLAMIITRWWKISAHTGAVGGLAGIIFWLGQKKLILEDPLICLSVTIALVALIAWARLYLKRHTPLQVLCGATLGFSVELVLLNIA